MAGGMSGHGVLGMLTAFAIAAWSSPAAAAAQQAQIANLTGTVYDPNGQPAENLLLMLVGRDSDVSVNVRSDGDGRFRVTSIPPGRYLLRTPVTRSAVPGGGGDDHG